MNNNLQFKNGKFKIMQIADIQEKAAVNPDTIKLISLALDAEKPDLVVFTGDQIMGYSASFKKNSKEKIKNALIDITAPLVKQDVPFCVTFGNHDNNSGVSNKEQMETIYKKIPSFVYGDMMGEDDAGSYSLQIKDSKGEKNIFNLYIIDSNSYNDHGGYAPVYKKQVEAYRAQREKIKEENGRYLPSLVFQHIPVCEIYETLKRVTKHTKGAIECYRTHKNEFYMLDEKTTSQGGFMYESAATPDENEGEFEAMKEKGEVLGIFFGHDHINSFVTELDGIKLGYTQCCGFNTYGAYNKRGVRIFELDESDLTNFKTHTLTIKDLDKSFKPSKPVYDFVLTHAPSSVEQGKKIAFKARLKLFRRYRLQSLRQS